MTGATLHEVHATLNHLVVRFDAHENANARDFAAVQITFGELQTAVSNQFASLRAELNERFGRVEARLDGVEQRLDRVEQRLDQVDQRLDRVEQRLDQVEQRLGRVEQRLDRLEQGLGRIEDKLDRVLAARPHVPRRPRQRRK